MLTSIHIQGFKGFKDTQIAPLRKVNLILGGQNVGKTSLLEAVYLGASNVSSYQRLASIFRVAEDGDSDRYVRSVLGKKLISVELSDDHGKVLRTAINSQNQPTGFFELQDGSLQSGFLDSSEWGGKIDQSIGGVGIEKGLAIAAKKARKEDSSSVTPAFAFKSLTFIEPLTVSVHLPHQLGLVQLLDQTVLSRKKKVLLEMLRSIEPRLEDMHSLSPDGEQRIYVELEGDGDALPLPQLGHGFSRLVYLYCSLLVTQAKLALIDEIENGIHYSSLPTLFQGIQDIAAKHDVQTMMTTHSWDCIRAAYKTFADADNLNDFQLIRLERDGDNVRAVVINDEALDTVMEAGYEVR
jgi:AAA15 family ATPase/GTPase